MRRFFAAVDEFKDKAVAAAMKRFDALDVDELLQQAIERNEYNQGAGVD